MSICTATLRNRVGSLLVLLCLSATSLFAQSVVWEPGLEAKLSALAPLEKTTVVVTFRGDGPPGAAQVSAVRALGVTEGITFRALPIMGVRATAAQVRAIAGLAGVRSVWSNAPLQYYNAGATQVTGVDRVRTDREM